MAINAYSNSYYNYLISGINPSYQVDPIRSPILGLVNSLNINSGIYKNNINSLLGNNGFKVNKTSAAATTQNYLTSIKSGSLTLKNSLASLMGTTKSSVLSQQTAVSSEPKKLQLDTKGMKSGTKVDLTVNIDRLASGQVNKGTALKSEQKTGGPALYEFSIENAGKTYQFSVNTTAADTNKSLQQKIAAAINKKRYWHCGNSC